jgi:hypothetical protein
MSGTNVELSKNELELVTSSEFILTKNRIIEKVYSLFGDLTNSYQKMLNDYKNILPAEAFSVSPKIYKGENYLGLPYVMMDYPRVFLKNDILAVRSFFWWGNFFSITLHLSGKFLTEHKNDILCGLKNKSTAELFVCIHDDQWNHQFETTNYSSLKDINIEEALQKPFFKIAQKLSLNDWERSFDFFESSYAALLKLLAAVNCQDDETIL